MKSKMPRARAILTLPTARILAAGLSLVMPEIGHAQTVASPSPLPFNRTLSNTLPFAFGMSADDVARALGTPLTYIRGRPGDEVFLAIRTGGGGGFFPRADRLYLQFRKGRLTGFKGDWGQNWMWR